MRDLENFSQTFDPKYQLSRRVTFSLMLRREKEREKKEIKIRAIVATNAERDVDS